LSNWEWVVPEPMMNPSYREDVLAEFAEWIVSLDDDDPESPGRIDRKTVTLTQIINRAKEALYDEPSATSI
jgi:hypothetical protein